MRGFHDKVFRIGNHGLLAPGRRAPEDKGHGLFAGIQQFDNLILTGKKNGGAITGNVWCALDTSGSMSSQIPGSDVTALDVCKSLGIYFSTLNEGAFHKNVIMFDSTSRVKQLSGSFSEMWDQIPYDAMGSTNFQSVVDEIVRIRTKNPNIPLSDYPKTLLVVSDMQFNPSNSWSWTRASRQEELSNIEAAKENWSVRWLGRQIHSSLYERIALSRDKEAVMKLAVQGQTMDKPTDILKSPIVLEFLGMDEKSSYTETTLETAILDKMQKFLLEIGKGFLFEARQKRFTFNEKHFFVDLVLYNRLLQCYVLVDLKTGELTHQDIGQMQMYTHYYDRCVKQDFEKPTIGILLCDKKDDAIV